MPLQQIITSLPRLRGSCHEVTEGGTAKTVALFGSPLRALRAHLPRKRGEGVLLVLIGFSMAACSPQTSETVETIDTAVVTQTTTPPIPPKTRTVDDIDFTAFSKDLAKFVGLEEGQQRWQAVDAVRLYFVPEDGSIIQTAQSSFDLPDGSVRLFSAAGLLDDSVKAEEIYLIFSGPKDDQKLAAYGSRIKCHRGENTTNWQKTLCP